MTNYAADILDADGETFVTVDLRDLPTDKLNGAMSEPAGSEKLTIRQLPHGVGFDYRADPEQRDHNPECDACVKLARWAVGKFEGFDQFGCEQWVTRHFACYQHLSGVLTTVEWDGDEVKVYDLAQYPEMS